MTVTIMRMRLATIPTFISSSSILLKHCSRWYNPLTSISMSSLTSAEEKPKKRAVRKRAVRKTAAKKVVKKAAVKKVARKRVSTRGSEESVRETTQASSIEREQSSRKSPTPIASKKAKSKAKQKQSIVIGAILLIGVIASAGVGFTDDGAIDVNEAIEARNERMRSGQLSDSDTKRVIVPVQNTEANKLPDGGLVGLGVGAEKPAPKPEPEVSTSTATSTDGVATSTDEVAEENVDSEEDGETTQPDTEVDTEEAPETIPEDSDAESMATEPAPDTNP